VHSVFERITAAFPWIVSIASALALWHPPLFVWFQGNLITLGLGGIMLGMGLTLQWSDFKQVAKTPRWILTGIVLQFTIMPLLGWALGYLFQLPTFFAVGLILVACCPGGTASNVIAYLARAHVALSVCMTTFSTLGAIVLTPLMMGQLSGSYVEVDAMGLFYSSLKVVLFPVALGVVLNRWLPQKTAKILPYAPMTAVLLITLIVASIIGQGRDIILNSGFRLLLALMSLHLLGFVLGFLISYVAFKNKAVAKTISIEVGMQNSGLGVVLAQENFANPMTAIPAAISSLIHSLYGSFFVFFFKDRGK